MSGRKAGAALTATEWAMLRDALIVLRARAYDQDDYKLARKVNALQKKLREASIAALGKGTAQ